MSLNLVYRQGSLDLSLHLQPLLVGLNFQNLNPPLNPTSHWEPRLVSSRLRLTTTHLSHRSTLSSPMSNSVAIPELDSLTPNSPSHVSLKPTPHTSTRTRYRSVSTSDFVSTRFSSDIVDPLCHTSNSPTHDRISGTAHH